LIFFHCGGCVIQIAYAGRPDETEKDPKLLGWNARGKRKITIPSGKGA